MVVQFKELAFDSDVQIAPVIYQDARHHVVPLGAIVDPEASAELLRFIQQYATFIGASPHPFFRLDVYIAEGRLWVLEVNAAFVDGWGVALNLSRAVSAQVLSDKLSFPGCFGLEDEAYRPELELLIAELAIAGQPHHHLCKPWHQRTCPGPIYVYGRVAGEGIWPQDGLALDNKLHLARFANHWRGEWVATPKTYSCENTDWVDVPQDVYLKFADKSSPDSRRARFSVKRGKPAGKSPFLRRSYNGGLLIAQERIDGLRVRVGEYDRQVQLVVLSNGQMLTGYVQYGLGDIINDNSLHGPLVL